MYASKEDVENITGFVERCYNERGIQVTTRSDEMTKGIRNFNGINAGGSICNSDVELILTISKLMKPKAIYGVGNAFGFSTITLGRIFPDVPIDIIDAETEGVDNHKGTEITRDIAKSKKFDINLFTGFSPYDTHKCLRNVEYDFVFIDGLHTNEQLLYDFIGIYSQLSPKCIVILHDVKFCNLYEGISKILKIDPHLRYQTYKSKNFINSIGTGFIHRGWDEHFFNSIADRVVISCKGYNLDGKKYQPNITYESNCATMSVSCDGIYHFVRSPETKNVGFQWFGLNVESKQNYIIDFDIRFYKFIPQIRPEIGVRFEHLPIVYNRWLKDCQVGEWKSVHYEVSPISPKSGSVLLLFDNAEASTEFDLRNFKVSYE